MLIVSIDRNVLGTLNLGDILSQRESIAREMQVLSPDESCQQTNRKKKIQKKGRNKKQRYESMNCQGNAGT